MNIQLNEPAAYALSAIAWAAAFGVLVMALSQCDAPTNNTIMLECVKQRGTWVTSFGGGSCQFPDHNPGETP